MKRRRFTGLWLAAVVASTAAFIVHLAMRFENVRLGYEVSSLQNEQRRLLEMKRTLAIEAQTLRRADRIEALAGSVFHMEVPGASRIVPMGTSARRSQRHTSGRVR